VLVELADADEGAAVLVDGDNERRYTAGELRRRLLDALRGPGPDTAIQAAQQPSPGGGGA
jgi:hypothetical protein